MKKLLSMIGAMTLIGTASTSVIACDKGEAPTPPTPDTRTDLKDIITNKQLNKIVISSGTVPTKVDLLKAIKDNNPSANDLTVSDFEFKQGTTPNSTTATIVGANGHKGEVVLTYEKDTRTDIENKITSPIALGQLSANTKVDFLAKLQTALARITDLNTITPSDYDVYKAGTTTAIQDSDITIGTSLNIKIVAKSNKFKGNKDNITTNYTQKDTRTDLSTITQLTGLNMTADTTKKFSDLDQEILKADQFLNKSKDNLQITYYTSKNYRTDITNNVQKTGTFFIKIYLPKGKQNLSWRGTTDYIQITIS